MLESVTNIMSCSLCESHCSEEPLYSCGHVVCEHCESEEECSACKFETNGNITPLSAKLINVLYDDLINISSEHTSGIQTSESNKVGFENGDFTNTRKKHLYILDNILETVKRDETVQIDLGEVNVETVIKSAEQSSENYCKPNTPQYCQLTDSEPIPFVLLPEALTEHEPTKRVYRHHSKRGSKRNVSNRRKRFNSKHSRIGENYINDSCSEFSDENCDTTPSINDENRGYKKVNKINVLSKFHDADVLELVERYRGLNSGNLMDECIQKNDKAFSEMPKLERQDIYEVDNMEFPEEERDMCNLEIEHDLYETTTILNNSGTKVSIDDVDQITKSFVEVKSKIDEQAMIDVAHNGSFENTSLNEHHDHSSALLDEGIRETGEKFKQFNLQEKRPVNVTLQRTSENCYKVKAISSIHEPVSNSVNVFNIHETQADSESINCKIEEPSVAVNNCVNMSSSEGYKTTSDNSSHAELSRKSRSYARKRKKKFYKSKSFDHLSNNSLGITSFSLNVESSDGEHHTSSGSDDSLNTHPNSYSLQNSYSCCLNNKSIKQLKRIKFETRSREERIRNSSEMNRHDFLGFKEDEILALSVKVLLFKSIINPSSSFSYYFGGKEVIIRNRQYVEKTFCGLQTQLKTPNNTPNLRVVSPVQTVERIGTNATLYLNSSMIDMATVASSTPAPVPSVRSRRQLLFDTPHIHNVHEFSKIEEDATEEHKYICNRDMELESDEIHYVVFGDTHADVKKLTDNSSQTSPLSVQRVPSSFGLVCPQPRQWGFQNQLDGLLDKTDLRVKEQDKNLCFAACGLTSSETVLVAKLARLTKSSLSRDFSHETTHLIVGEGERGSNEYLLAIAYRAYIVTIDWVILCIRENTVLSPMDFISGTEEGPRRCLEPVPLPFEGFYIFFKMSPSVSDYSSYELTKTLCSLGGAKVILDHEKFNPFVYAETFPRFFIFEDRSQLTDLVLDKCKRLQVVPLSSNWVQASISAFRSQPILDYLGVPTNRSQLSHEYHIPLELLIHSPRNKES